MTMRVRASLMLVVAMMGLASCDHYNCPTGATFGSSSCTASAAGLGGGTGTGTATAAFVFVSNGSGGTGAVEGYTLDTSVAPPTLGATPSYTAPATPGEDAGMGMVVAQKQFLYTAFGSTSQIFGWTIGSAGTLTAVSGSPYTAPFLSAASTTFDTQEMATNPAGTLLFIADAALDKIFVYQIGTAGVLTAATGSPFTVPFSPGNLTTDGSGKYLYIAEELGNHTGSEVGAYAIGSTGALTVVPGSPFVFPMWQVQGEPTGQFLIGTTGQSEAVNGTDNDNLYVFSITQSGTTAGAIAPVSGSPFPTTNSPLSIAVQSNTGGNLIYSFGVADSDLAFNPVEAYTLSSSGALSAVTGSPFTSAEVGDVGQFDQTGDFVFIYGGVVTDNTVAYTVTAFGVASGVPSELISTGTYGGYWVVTDAP
jgi:6-phosphogluconolactonase